MSFTSVEFCDTNVHVYAADGSGDPRGLTARRLVDDLWRRGAGGTSVQVLQEVYVVMTRRARPPASPEDARSVVEQIGRWHTFEPTSRDVLEAIDNSLRWQVSFWDAMLLTAANAIGARVLWSEDLNHGQTYGQTTVRNPFV